jgi:hypothetical protein
MYSHNFAAAIKVNGKILREFGDAVYLPFGSEYEIRLKNLNYSRAKVTIEIDGENVTGGGLILNTSETVDLERFIRNGNLTEGNRFKFIERTNKIENHRGIKLEDGLITIHYEFEFIVPEWTYSRPTVPIKYYSGVPMSTTNAVYGDNFQTKSISANTTRSLSETGITVEGSKSEQKFSTTKWKGSIGNAGVLTIKMLGETEENKKIREPVTVKTKLECKTCGTINPATAKFCSECGTSLHIV